MVELVKICRSRQRGFGSQAVRSQQGLIGRRSVTSSKPSIFGIRQVCIDGVSDRGRRVRPHFGVRASEHTGLADRHTRMLAATRTATVRAVVKPRLAATPKRSLGRSSRSNPPRSGRHATLYGPVVQLFHPAGGGSSSSNTPASANKGGDGPDSVAAMRKNPRQLVAHLDEYVVGQTRAKRVLAVA